MSSVKKSFNTVDLKADNIYTIPDNQIVNITNFSTSTETMSVTDNYSGDNFDLQIGETITLNWGFVNNSITIVTPSGATGRVIYYR